MEQFPSYGVYHIGVPSYLHGKLLSFNTILRIRMSLYPFDQFLWNLIDMCSVCLVNVKSPTSVARWPGYIYIYMFIS
jgi:hypothetical protein